MATTPHRRPDFDPELAGILGLISGSLPTLVADAISEFRASAAKAVVLTDAVLQAAGVVRRDVIGQGFQGAEMPLSVLARADHTGLGPGIYHLHGGGMVAGDRLLGTAAMLPWIVEHDAVLVSPEYRLAPEFPDPYPVEDCYAGLVWAAEHARGLGIDPERILVGGGSAGGGLAAGVALIARDRGGPGLIGQLLMSPMLDDRDTSLSTEQYGDVGTWTRAHNRVAWGALLGSRRGTADVSAYAAPIRSTDLSGLPPTYLDCGSAEIFRDECVAYASALWAAGVQAELHVWAGGFHGFDVIAPYTAVGQSSIAARDSWVARLLGS